MKNLFKLSILDRYIMKEILYTFMLSLISINMILMMEKLLRLTRLLAGIGATMVDFIYIIILLQPQLALLTVPMSFMTATLFTYSRLSVDNELVVLKGAGASFDEIIRPVFRLSILCFFLCVFISFYLGPLSSKTLRLKVTNIIAYKAPLAIKERTFHTLFPKIVIFVHKKISPAILENVFIYDKRDIERPWAIFSKNAQIVHYDDLSTGFVLEKGEVFFTKDDSVTKLFFKTYNMKVSVDPEIHPKMSELTPFELIGESYAKASESERRSLEVEFQRRLTFPFMSLLAGLLAPCMALMAGAGGRLSGLSMGIGFFLAYYSVLTYFENLAKSGRISSLIGGWTAFVLALILTLYLFKRQRNR